ncbi:hypothetical protein [Spongiibacter tropicus]|uniref:hypothetical protein n=1 Tax=Spongiibacter tropicus TaxID=454602 RepID=UPI002355981E|nr:hypothetical protein [Spongiibacter tropicus]
MNNPAPHIGVQYPKHISEGSISVFLSEIDHSGLSLAQDETEGNESYAGLEWLMPTAVMVFIAKPYFDSFLKEAGKDHYHILKNAIGKLAKESLVN